MRRIQRIYSSFILLIAGLQGVSAIALLGTASQNGGLLILLLDVLLIGMLLIFRQRISAPALVLISFFVIMLNIPLVHWMVSTFSKIEMMPRLLLVGAVLLSVNLLVFLVVRWIFPKRSVQFLLVILAFSLTLFLVEIFLSPAPANLNETAQAVVEETRATKETLAPNLPTLEIGIPEANLFMRYTPNNTWYHQYSTDPYDVLPDPDNMVTYNIGDLGCRELDIESVNGGEGYNILVLGDSFAYGTGVDFEDSFPAQLQTILSDRVENVRVINCGHGGYDTVDELNAYRHFLADAIDHDLVLLQFLSNDWRASVKRTCRDNVCPETTSLSRLFLTIPAIERFVIVSQEGTGTRIEDFQDAFTSITALEAEAQARGVALVTFIYPNMDDNHLGEGMDWLFEGFAQFLDAQAIPHFDVRLAFADIEFVREEFIVHPIDRHPNRRGHAIVAGAVAEALQGMGMLP